VVVDATRYDEDDLMAAIDAGALDIERDDDVFEVLTEPAALSAVREALEASGVAIESSELRQQPKSRVRVEDDAAPQLLRLIDALEEQDDVDVVHANFDVSADLLERVAG
jgi:transcriptional/translational regulatory protein YebC/TACO1